MSQLAFNPATGEYAALVGNAWVPVTQVAENPETKERVGLVNNAWLPLPPAAKTKADEPPVPVADMGNFRRGLVSGAINVDRALIPQLGDGVLLPETAERDLAFKSYGQPAENLKTMDAIDAGKLKPKAPSRGISLKGLGYDPLGMGNDTSMQDAEEQAKEYFAHTYYKASPKAKQAMRQRELAKVSRVNADYDAAIAKMETRDKAAAPYRGDIQSLSDVNSLGDFGKLAAHTIGSVVAPSLAYGVVARRAPIGSKTLGVGGVGTALAYSGGEQERLRFAMDKYKELPPAKQAEAVAKYVVDSGDVTLAVAVASGAIDAGSGIGGQLIRRAVSAEVKKAAERKAFNELTKQAVPTVRGAAKRGAVEALRTTAEEGAAGGAQQLSEIAGQFALNERDPEDRFFSAKTAKEVGEGALMEAIGGAGIGSIGIGTSAAGAQLSKRRVRSYNADIDRQAEASDLNLSSDNNLERWNAIGTKLRRENPDMSDAELIIKAKEELDKGIPPKPAQETPDATGPVDPGAAQSGVPSPSGQAAPQQPAGQPAGAGGAPVGGVGLDAAGAAVGEVAGQPAVDTVAARQARRTAADAVLSKALPQAGYDLTEADDNTYTRAVNYMASGMPEYADPIDAFEAARVDELSELPAREAQAAKDAKKAAADAKKAEKAAAKVKADAEKAAAAAAKKAGQLPLEEDTGWGGDDLSEDDIAALAAQDPATGEPAMSEANSFDTDAFGGFDSQDDPYFDSSQDDPYFDDQTDESVTAAAARVSAQDAENSQEGPTVDEALTEEALAAKSRYTATMEAQSEGAAPLAVAPGNTRMTNGVHDFTLTDGSNIKLTKGADGKSWTVTDDRLGETYPISNAAKKPTTDATLKAVREARKRWAINYALENNLTPPMTKAAQGASGFKKRGPRPAAPTEEETGTAGRARSLTPGNKATQAVMAQVYKARKDGLISEAEQGEIASIFAPKDAKLVGKIQEANDSVDETQAEIDALDPVLPKDVVKTLPPSEKRAHAEMMKERKKKQGELSTRQDVLDTLQKSLAVEAEAKLAAVQRKRALRIAMINNQKKTGEITPRDAKIKLAQEKPTLLRLDDSTAPSAAKASRAKLDAAAEMLRKELVRLGLPDVVVSLSRDGPAGSYDSWLEVIGVAFRLSEGEMVGTLHHEVIHHLRNLGLINEQEWAVLAETAAGNKRLQDWYERKYKDVYSPEKFEAMRAEEIVAEMFSEWMQGRRGNFTSARGVLQKLQNLFIGIGRIFKRAGFKSAEEVFKAIDSGEIAAREPNRKAAPTDGILYAQPPQRRPGWSRAHAAWTRKFNRSLHATASQTGAWAIQMPGDLWRGTKAHWQSISDPVKRTVLQAATVRGIVARANAWSPRLGAHLNKIRILFEQIAQTRTDLFRHLEEQVRPWDKWLKENKNDPILDVYKEFEAMANLERMDPRGRTSLADFMANDKKLRELKKPPSGNASNPGAVSSREDMLTNGWMLWEELGQHGQGEGQLIFDMVVEGHLEDLNARERLQHEHVDNSGASAVQQAEAHQKITDMYNKLRENGVYIPVMRYGDHWLQIVAPNGEVTKTPYESAAARNRARLDEVARLQRAGDPRTESQMVEDGDIKSWNQKDSLQHFLDNDLSGQLKDVYEQLAASPTTINMDDIKDLIYQMYVDAMPEGSAAKKMAHRSGVAGFSTDSMRNYLSSRTRAANQRARMTYADELRKAYLSAHALASDSADSAALMPFVSEMGKRVDAQVAPEVDDGFLEKAAVGASRLAFWSFMTTGKAMFTQLTQLPIVGTNVLAAEYGVGPTTALAARTMATLWKRLGRTENHIDLQGNVTTSMGTLSVANSKDVRNNADPELGHALQYAFRTKAHHPMFGNTNTAMLTERAQSPSDRFGSRTSVGMQKINEVLSFGIHHGERLSREIMFRSAVELEFKKQRKLGVPASVAEQLAAEKATELTQEAMFDFSSHNRGRLFKHPVARVAFQFMQFTVHMVSFLTTNALTMISTLPTREEKRKAAVKLFGTLGMSFLFSGLSGLPGYSLLWDAVGAIRELLRPEYEPEDEKSTGDPYYDMISGGDPLGKRDPKMWFEQTFLPNLLGRDRNKPYNGDLADMAVLGPLSVLTGLDLGTSASLDMIGNDDFSSTNNKSDRSAFLEGLAEMGIGPSGKQLLDTYDGVNMMMEGKVLRGLEKALPVGLLRGPIKTLRFMDEGVRGYQGQEIAKKGALSGMELVGQAIGWTPTQIKAATRKARQIKNRDEKVVKEKEEVLAKAFDTYFEYDKKPTDDNWKAYLDTTTDVIRYNDKNGAAYPILPGAVEAHVKAKMEALDEAGASGTGLMSSKGFEGVDSAALNPLYP